MDITYAYFTTPKDFKIDNLKISAYNIACEGNKGETLNV